MEGGGGYEHPPWCRNARGRRGGQSQGGGDSKRVMEVVVGAKGVSSLISSDGTAVADAERCRHLF